MNFPQAIADRCVHSLLETATCNACVKACPSGAWILNDDALALDLETCDGCGLCQPECPEGAIDISQSLATRTWRGQRIAMAACERAGVEETNTILPCIHSLGLQEILRLYGRSIMGLVVAMGNCDECPRGGKAPRLHQRIASLNKSLRQSGNPPFVLEQKPLAEWSSYRSKTKDAPAGPLLNRRGFLRALVETDKNSANNLHIFLGRESELFAPPAQLLPDLADDSILPNVPDIDSRRCSGCDACIRVCPHGALSLDLEDSVPSYRLMASRCTGCGMCIDICDQDAITIQHWATQEKNVISLGEMRCSACGVPFHEPAVAGKDLDSLCRICSQKNHHQKLFQIV